MGEKPEKNTLKHIRYILGFILVFSSSLVQSQCLTNSIVINTGYDPVTGLAIPGGANGATAVPDPHWVVNAIAPSVSAAILATAGTIPGIAAAPIGGPARVITPITGAWVANPAGNPGNWISCMNSNTYNDPGTGVVQTMELGRPFRMCSDDSVRINIFIAADNFISAINVDGTIVFPVPGTGYSGYSPFSQTVWLTAGTHRLNIVVNNQPTTPSSNPMGLNVYGTFASATGLNSIVSESYASCASYICGSTCNSFTLADTLHICEQTTGNLSATVVGSYPVLSTVWTPVTGLSSSTILNPTITVGATSGYYYITQKATTPYNLVSNGDFSLGNTAFFSTYGYTPPPSGVLNEGFYSVYTNPNGVHSGFTSFGDHTTGTGNMMILNGSPSPTSVWCQTIPVTPNTDYDFSAWFANCSASSTGGSAPILQFMVNAVLIGTPTTVTAAPGVWTQFSTIWNSGASTTAQICIYDNNTTAGGNDFVIDDITFREICVATDSIYIDVNLVDTTLTHKDTTACAPISAVTLTAPAGYASYQWSTGSTAVSIVVGAAGNYIVNARGNCTLLIDTFKLAIAPVDTTYTHADSAACASAPAITLVAPAGYTSYQWSTGNTTSTLSVTTAGDYIVYASGPCVVLVDTFHVVFNPLPNVFIGNDTSFCAGNTVVLSSIPPQPAGSTLLWNTGSTADTIHVSSGGTYWLQVYNGCYNTDSIHINIDPLPVVDLGPDTNNCQGFAVPLQSSVTYPATYTYLWNTTATTNSITAVTTDIYWLEVSSNANCKGSDTVIVQILYDTVTLHTNDTAICKGQTLQVWLTGNPMFNTYQWIPTTGIAAPTVGSPVIIGDTSATYVVTAYFPGCPDIVDSFHLDVQPNPTTYIGGNREVCKFDTLHLHGNVAPGWYTNYIYSWSPSVSIDFPNLQDVVFTAGDSTTIIFTVTTPAGCTAVDSAKLFVHPGNFAHVDSLFDICPRDSVQLKPFGADHYEWYPTMYIDSPTSLQPWVYPVTSQSYQMVGISEYGCRDTQNVMIYVHPSAVIFLEDSVLIYPGESYHIQPQTNASEFLWTPTSGLKGRFFADPVVTPEVSTKYIVTASTEFGCTVKDSIMVYVSDDGLVSIPNAFVPGSANSVFKVIKRGIVALNYFRIFDRWGVMVYESKDIDAGWDGTYKGKPQPFGVYIYQVEAVTQGGQIFRQHGNVTLIR